MENENGIKLGAFVEDVITGFAGIAYGRAEYMTGCDQIYVQPRSKKKEFNEGVWIDEGRLKYVPNQETAINPDDVTGDKNGGPRMEAPNC